MVGTRISYPLSNRLKQIADDFDTSTSALLAQGAKMIVESYQNKVKNRIEISDLSGLIFAGTSTKKENKWRLRELVIRRQSIMTIRYLFSDVSLRSAGMEFDKDHSTVRYSIIEIQKAISTRDKYVMEIFYPVYRLFYLQHENEVSNYDFLSKYLQLEVDRISERLERYGFTEFKKTA